MTILGCNFDINFCITLAPGSFLSNTSRTKLHVWNESSIIVEFMVKLIWKHSLPIRFYGTFKMSPGRLGFCAQHFLRQWHLNQAFFRLLFILRGTYVENKAWTVVVSCICIHYAIRQYGRPEIVWRHVKNGASLFPGCGWSRVYVYNSNPHRGWVFDLIVSKLSMEEKVALPHRRYF